MKKLYQIGLRGKTSAVLGGLIFIVLIITSFISYKQSQSVVERIAIDLEQSKFVLLKHEIENTLSNHHKNLLSLHDVPPIQSILRARANNNVDPQNGDTLQEWRRRLMVIFGAFLANHPEYQQIRYIDVAGDELVRVHAGNGRDVVMVAEDKLQNKLDSHYVTETIKLTAGEAYYSDVTLNREQGVIQLPYLPVLRIASPVHDENGQVAALIVINLSTERLFSGVLNETNGVQRNIVDNKGYFIKHADPSRTFGLERFIDYKFSTVEPFLAELAKSQDQFMGLHESKNELYGFQKIYFSPQDKSRYWMLTLNVPEKVVFSGISDALNKMMFVSLFIGLISVVFIIWFVSSKILTPVVVLASTAKRLQRGDLEARVDASSTQNEFQTLSMAINAFAENQQHATHLLERQVAEQTKRLSAVIDNVVDGIITMSDTGIIESINPAGKRLFGYSDAEIIDENVKILMPEPYHSEHDGYLKHHRDTGERKIIGIGREVTGRRKDGSTFPMELAVGEIIMDERRHFVGITRDITERKKAEDSMRRAREVAETANRQKTSFLNVMSHELRTPLTVILGYLPILKDPQQKLSTEMIVRIASDMDLSGQHLLKMINDLLDISKIEAGELHLHLEEAQSVDMVDEILRKFENQAKSIGVLLVNDVTEFSFSADVLRLTQIFINLIGNALKFTNQGAITISATQNQEYVQFSVSDTGIGIKEEELPFIFNNFHQVDDSSTRKVGGSGLGLAITKRLVTLHGGEIEVTSDVGVGTRFSFTIKQ